jgi:hypothetical protein
MKLCEKAKHEIMVIVAESFEESFETGQFYELNDFDMAYVLLKFYPEDTNDDEFDELIAQAVEYYGELVNLGPAGFYEEFKDEYDFDPMFITEFGDN